MVGSKWAIGIRGHVVTARTALDLVPGTRLRAHVHSDGSGFVLRLGERPADILATALARQGVSGDETSKLIARSLMAVGLPVRAETVALLRRIMTSWPAQPPAARLTPSRLARSLAGLLARGVDLTSPGVRALIEQMNFDGPDGSQQQHTDQQRRGGRRGPRQQRRQGRQPRQPLKLASGGDPTSAAGSIAEDLRRHLTTPRAAHPHASHHGAGPEAGVAALAVFNHLPEQTPDRERWCVVPVAVRDDQGATAVAGTLRLCFRGQTMVQALLDAATAGPDGGKLRATFVLPGGLSEGPLRVVAEDASSASVLAEALPQLADKVRNLGFEVDDIVEEDPAYDGFATGPAEAGYQQVDTLR